LVVKRLQLPCLFSAEDMSEMRMIVDHNKHVVTLGKERIEDKLIICPEDFKLPVNLLNTEVIQPMEETIVEVTIGVKSPSPVNLLIQPSEEFVNTYHIDCFESLDETRDSGISHVTVVNFTDHPINLKAGIEIGKATTVNIIQPEVSKQSSKIHSKLSRREIRKRYKKDFQLNENSYLTEGQKEQLLDLLSDFEDVISSGPADIGRCEEVKCHIPTEEGKTVKSQCRPLPPYLKENLKEQLNA